MLSAIADTHAIIWYLDNDARLSARAAATFAQAATSGDTIGIASITFVEMVYLSEKGRISAASLQKLYDALLLPQPLFVEMVLDRAIARALATVARDAIPDMPDRIIAATAVHHSVPLISHDGKIQTSAVATIW
jgi:PIN domain nuclease of toxin-antitoxin system